MSQATLPTRPVVERATPAPQRTAGETLAGRLAALRYRLLAIRGGAAVVWAVFAAALALLAGVWLDLIWELSPNARFGVWIAAGCGGAAAGLWLLAACLRELGSRALVRRLDRAAQSGGEIVTGYELHAAQARGALAYQAKGAASAPLTAGMARIAIERASRRAIAVPAAEAAEWRPLSRAAIALLSLALLVGLLALLMPRLAATQWLRFTQFTADAPPFSQLQFEIEPGNTQVRYGDSLEISAVATGAPVDRLDLILVDAQGAEQTLPMFAESRERWRAMLGQILEPGEYYVRAPRARSRRYAIEVITVPRIEQARVRVSQPAYANRGPYEGPLPEGGIAGLPGSKVELWLRSNRPLSGGSIEVAAGEQSKKIAMQPTADAHEVRGEFTIEQPGGFEARVTDIAGQDSREAVSGALTLLADHRPLVRILQPKPMSLATPNAMLPVELAAEDDYGLTQVQLFRGLNDSRLRPQSFSLPATPPTRHGERAVLPLAQYGLSPGDTIKIFARVEDNDPAGAKGFESAIVTVQIISQEDFDRLVRMREGIDLLLNKYRQANRRLERIDRDLEELLKEAQEAEENAADAKANEPIANDSPLRDALRQAMQEMREDAAALQAAAQSMLPYDLDQELSPELQKLAEEFAKQAEELEKLAEKGDLTPKELAEALEAMRAQMGQQKKNFEEQVTQPLDRLAAAFPLKAAESRFVRLVQAQTDLAERLATFKDRDGQDDPAMKARMRELEGEQQALREELIDLLQDIEDAAHRLPFDPEFEELRISAFAFVQAVRESGAAGMMSEAELALANFSGTRGWEQANEAAETLQKFLGQCEAMGGQAGGCLSFCPCLSQNLGNTVEQLLAAMGMNSGSGQGMGSGYGMSGSTAQNTGLYGQIPAGLERTAGGDGRQQNSQSRGQGNSAGDDAPNYVEGAVATEAGGAGDPTIPPQYRKRVGLYFQRLAEELGED